MTKAELRDRLDWDMGYHAPDGFKVAHHQAMRAAIRVMADVLVDVCPVSRELSLAITSLEEALMWANAAVARDKPPEEKDA